jgi:heme oxygenase
LRIEYNSDKAKEELTQWRLFKERYRSKNKTKEEEAEVVAGTKEHRYKLIIATKAITLVTQMRM